MSRDAVATPPSVPLPGLPGLADGGNAGRERLLARLLQVATSTTNLVVLTDAERRIEWVNEAFTRITGYGLAEVVGRRPGALLQFDGTDPRTVQRLRAALDAGRGVQAEILNRGKSGREYWLSLDIQPVRRPDGALDGFVAVQTDVTALKRAAGVAEDLARETALHDLLLAIASRYLHTPVERVDAAITEALGELGRFVAADRAYLFDYDWAARTTTNTHEWCAPGIPPQRARLQRLPLADLGEWAAAHAAGESVHVPDVEALPAGSELRALLAAQGIRSLLTIPVMDGDRCEGFLGFDFVRAPYACGRREHTLLRFFSDISRSLRTHARLELLSREVGEQIRRLEERRRVQEAVALERVEHEARLTFALVEARRLHERDRELRRADEMMVRALRSLSEAPDPAGGPLLLLRQLAAALRTDCAAIVPLDPAEAVTCAGAAGWWEAARGADGAVAYLGARVTRLIADLSAVPALAPVAATWPAGRLGWMACARLGTEAAGALLVAAGPAEAAPVEGWRQTFVRFVPLVEEAMRRDREHRRSARLEQERQQAQKLEALGTLAAGIAHEINSPMQYIFSNLDFLRDALADVLARLERLGGTRPAVDGSDPELAELLAEIPEAIDQSLVGCRRVAEIVEAVRAVAYPNVAPDQRVDVRSAIEHCLVVTRGIWKHEIDVTLDGAASVPTLVGSPGQISQVFINLTTNACDAVRALPDGRRGVVRLTLGVDAGDVRVDVDDNGPGVPAALRHRIFDRFFTTKALGEGTGRGLDICRGIVERHGGTIALADSPLGGARFTVRLPLHAPAPDA